MNLTPEQAREKWCPMVRIARREQEHRVEASNLTVVGGCNTDALGRTHVPASCRCIADDCAMWRWVPSTTTHKESQIEERKYLLPGGRYEMRHLEVAVDVPDAPTVGYCGLAGRPEVAP